jgi:hypothetical protein
MSTGMVTMSDGRQADERSLYERLLEAGCQMDHHESDLYVRMVPDAVKILREHYGVRFGTHGGCTLFRSPVDGRIWIDCPFMYDPFWQRVRARGVA